MWICVSAYTGLSRRLFSGGEHGRKQVVDLLSLSVNNYMYRQSHPALRHLQKTLCSCIAQHYNSFLEPEVLYFWVFVDVHLFKTDPYWLDGYLQLGRRVGAQYSQNRKVDIRDMQTILKSTIKYGKITVWNQLLVQHDEVQIFLLCKIVCIIWYFTDFMYCRS